MSNLLRAFAAGYVECVTLFVKAAIGYLLFALTIAVASGVAIGIVYLISLLVRL